MIFTNKWWKIAPSIQRTSKSEFQNTEKKQEAIPTHMQYRTSKDEDGGRLTRNQVRLIEVITGRGTHYCIILTQAYMGANYCSPYKIQENKKGNQDTKKMLNAVPVRHLSEVTAHGGRSGPKLLIYNKVFLFFFCLKYRLMQ